ncbi:twin-arginine translocase subunit TatC [Tepidibacter hydrothermalis]|uniref:Sec-independent protein translocase protein TatC n=1 Tax=Tepidibacter hydrothermalis TaxID=3036126 RepID=A0ABY8EH63_9FIRM|nr:twin-arginine translocase subunit TatC [Tepidibacter hydrothermalis]WFD12258.1 twin-arginine translocase subunit TatC [Tepidibacter hydrothermalis]
MSNEFEMTIIEHLDELRKRLIICIVFTLIFSSVAYVKSASIIELLKLPLGDIDLVFITPIEGFLTKLKVAVFGGMLLSSPVMFLQTLLFISPAMYKREKVFLFLSLPFIISLFFGGIYFCFSFILPTTLKFLMSFSNDSMQPMLSVNKYFSFVIMMTLSIGLIFELPLVMLLLSKFGIINYEMLAKKRKYAVLAIVVITAILTPTPDAFTLLAVSLPLVVLFELSLGLMYLNNKIIGKRRAKDEQDY